jgi:hypothetical protein
MRTGLSKLNLKRHSSIANYGFAQAIREGKFEYKNGVLGIRNRRSIVSASFDCASSVRFTVKALRINGIDAYAYLMKIPTLRGANDIDVVEHLVTQVRDGNGGQRIVCGFTPYDKLLGIYPHAEVTEGSMVKRHGKEDKDDQILNQTNLAMVFSRIRRPANPAGFVPEADLIPLSSFSRRGLFGITNLGLSFSEKEGTFLFRYSVEFFGKGNSAFPLAIPAYRTLRFCLTPENFAGLRQTVVERQLRFTDFYAWIQDNQAKLTDFEDEFYVPPRSPLLMKAIGTALITNWPTVAAFLQKLPEEVLG